MVAWTGIEHFRVGRYDPPPPAEDPEDFQVCFLNIYKLYELEAIFYQMNLLSYYDFSRCAE
jgi:hypothetical protein